MQLYDLAWLRLPSTAAPDMANWLLAPRSHSDPTQITYFQAFGPTGTPVEDLVWVADIRWTIEEGFEDVRGPAGLDQYEVRKWNAWYRHITLALLTYASLEMARRAANTAEKGEPVDSSG